MTVEIILYLTIVTGMGKQDIHYKFPESVDAKRLIAGCSVEQSKEDSS